MQKGLSTPALVRTGDRLTLADDVHETSYSREIISGEKTISPIEPSGDFIRGGREYVDDYATVA